MARSSMGLFRVSKSRNQELKSESEAALRLMTSYGIVDQTVLDEIFREASDSHKNHIEVKGEPFAFMRERHPEIVAIALSEGATEQEIADYWGTPRFLRALEYHVQQHIKFQAFKDVFEAAIVGGSTNEEASAHAGTVVHRRFPNFGVQDKSLGDAAPLPNELNSRVMALPENPTDGTFNAYIRTSIQKSYADASFVARVENVVSILEDELPEESIPVSIWLLAATAQDMAGVVIGMVASSTPAWSDLRDEEIAKVIRCTATYFVMNAARNDDINDYFADQLNISSPLILSALVNSYIEYILPVEDRPAAKRFAELFDDPEHSGIASARLAFDPIKREMPIDEVLIWDATLTAVGPRFVECFWAEQQRFEV